MNLFCYFNFVYFVKFKDDDLVKLVVQCYFIENLGVVENIKLQIFLMGWFFEINKKIIDLIYWMIKVMNVF